MQRPWILASAVLLFLGTISISGTTVIPMDLDDLVGQADRIIVGTVTASEAYWNESPRVILTRHTIAVSETLKGITSSHVDVTTVGGSIGDLALEVPGMAAFREGESAVIFLNRRGGFNTVVGLSQGKFGIRRGRAANRLDGLEFLGTRPATSVEMDFGALRREILMRVGTVEGAN